MSSRGRIDPACADPECAYRAEIQGGYYIRAERGPAIPFVLGAGTVGIVWWLVEFVL